MKQSPQRQQPAPAPAPVATTPAEARKTSKPGAGVVKFAFEVINQKDELIQVGTMTVLMKTKDHPVPIKR